MTEGMAGPETRKAVHGIVPRHDGVVRVAVIRTRGTLRNINTEWAEVRLQIQLNPDAEWLDLLEGGLPLLVARRYSGSEGQREAPELYVISALKQTIQAEGALVLSMLGSQSRALDGATEWAYWAHLAGRLSVAIRTRPDGSVAIIGLV